MPLRQIRNGDSEEIAQMNERLRLGVSVSVTICLAALFFAYLLVLRKVEQPMTGGTVLLAKLVMAFLAAQIVLAWGELSGKVRLHWTRVAVPLLILMSLTTAIYLQWFMVSVKGSLW